MIFIFVGILRRQHFAVGSSHSEKENHINYHGRNLKELLAFGRQPNDASEQPPGGEGVMRGVELGVIH